MIEILTEVAILASVFIIMAGVGFFHSRRQRQRREAEARKKSAAAFLELERRRLKTFPDAMSKEIAQVVKQGHPDSTRHERRAVAKLYRRLCNNC